jgi:hypothetical protein
VVFAAGAWAVFVHFLPAPEAKPPQEQIKADCGSVAIGGDVSGATIRAGSSGECRKDRIASAKAAEKAALEDERRGTEREERYRQAALEQERRRQEELALLEQRQQEKERCPDGFARVDGSCQRNPPPKHREQILETGYSLLKDVGGEEQGYGLYSYAILVNNNDRSAKFLNDVFGEMSTTTPPIEETAAQPSQTNILYITLK